MSDREPINMKKGGVSGCFPDGDVLPAGTSAAMHTPRKIPSGWEAIERHKRLMAEHDEYQRQAESKSE